MASTTTASPPPLARTPLPPGSFLTLPLVPVLAVLASRSDRCRERCLQYVNRQRDLIERKVAEALVRKREADRSVTRKFRGYAAACERLAAAPSRPQAGVAYEGAVRTEAYLGVGSA